MLKTLHTFCATAALFAIADANISAVNTAIGIAASILLAAVYSAFTYPE